MQHIINDLDITAKYQRVFGGKKVTALFAKARYFNATPTNRYFAVFHNKTLMAGAGKFVPK